MIRETYTFKVAPEYTHCSYDRSGDCAPHSCTMEEWCGRTADEFNSKMKNRGFTYGVEEYELSGNRKIVEHTWTPAR